MANGNNFMHKLLISFGTSIELDFVRVETFWSVCSLPSLCQLQRIVGCSAGHHICREIVHTLIHMCMVGMA